MRSSVKCQQDLCIVIDRRIGVMTLAMMREETSRPAIQAFRPFVICTPANFEETKAFYRDLGFKPTFDNGNDACGFCPGPAGSEFLVTLHHGIEPPQNAMLQFRVENAQEWYDYMMSLDLASRHPSITITPPVVTDWGWLITYVADPAGVKLHFGQLPAS